MCQMKKNEIDISDLSKIYNYEYGKSAIMGNESNICKVREWFTSVANKDPLVANCILITGHSGLGKSHCVERFCNEFDFFPKITYALDIRQKSFYTEIFNERINTQITIVDSRYIMKKKRVILVFDEIDSETSISNILDYLKSLKKSSWNKKIPIVLIGNNKYDSKFSNLSPKYAEHVHFEKLTNIQMRVIYNRICNGNIKSKYFQQYKFPDLIPDGDKMIKEANGDVRYMLNNLSINKQYIQPKKRGRKKKGCVLQTVKDSSNRVYFGKEECYNLWEIYDMIVNNRDVSIDDLIRISALESNWIVNGLYENYLDIYVEFWKMNLMKLVYFDIDIMDIITDISENFSLTNCIETMVINYNHLTTIQNYVRCISLYSLNLQLRKCSSDMKINSIDFRFPSYFGKVSNRKITEIAVKNILNKLSINDFGSYQKSGDVSFPYYFRYIVVEKLLIEECIEKIEEEGFEKIVEKFSSESIKYGITLDDFLILLRPHVFGMIDLRKCLNTQTKKLLKVYYNTMNGY